MHRTLREGMKFTASNAERLKGGPLAFEMILAELRFEIENKLRKFFLIPVSCNGV